MKNTCTTFLLLIGVTGNSVFSNSLNINNTNINIQKIRSIDENENEKGNEKGNENEKGHENENEKWNENKKGKGKEKYYIANLERKKILNKGINKINEFIQKYNDILVDIYPKLCYYDNYVLKNKDNDIKMSKLMYKIKNNIKKAKKKDRKDKLVFINEYVKLIYMLYS